jgi:hypothetical protein
MPRVQNATSASTLLCERCGYTLEGLDPSTNCPECGRPIADSLPTARTGTPFQNDPTWRGFARQCAMLAREPGTVFVRARIRHIADTSMLLRSTAAASLAAVAPSCALLLAAAWRDVREHEVLIGVLVAGLLWVFVNVVLLSLTAVERIGVTFFATRRGWRVPPPVARTICAHAAPGWIAAAVLLNAGLFLMPAAMRVARDIPAPWRAWAEGAAVSLPLVGFVIGMLAFETLVYIGVQRCRYANWAARPISP